MRFPHLFPPEGTQRESVKNMSRGFLMNDGGVQITTLEVSVSLNWWQHTSRVLARRLP